MRKLILPLLLNLSGCAAVGTDTATIQILEGGANTFLSGAGVDGCTVQTSEGVSSAAGKSSTKVTLTYKGSKCEVSVGSK